jgi:hypothetical protein
VAIDPKHLPEAPKVLQQVVLDLMAQLDREFTERNKIDSPLRELLDAKRNRKSEQLSPDQLALSAAAWQARASGGRSLPKRAVPATMTAIPPPAASVIPLPRKSRAGSRFRGISSASASCTTSRKKRNTASCKQDLRLIGEETCERYEYVPAQVTVIEDVCKQYVFALARCKRPPSRRSRSRRARREPVCWYR